MSINPNHHFNTVRKFCLLFTNSEKKKKKQIIDNYNHKIISLKSRIPLCRMFHLISFFYFHQHVFIPRIVIVIMITMFFSVFLLKARLTETCYSPSSIHLFRVIQNGSFFLLFLSCLLSELFYFQRRVILPNVHAKSSTHLPLSR